MNSLLKEFGVTVILNEKENFQLYSAFYIFVEDQLRNNYLIVEQRVLGCGFVLIAFTLLLNLVIDRSKYEYIEEG